MRNAWLWLRRTVDGVYEKDYWLGMYVGKQKLERMKTWLLGAIEEREELLREEGTSLDDERLMVLYEGLELVNLKLAR